MEEETEYFSFPLKETKKFFARFVRNAVGFGRAVENFVPRGFGFRRALSTKG